MDEMLMPWPASREGLKWGHLLSFGLGQHSVAVGLTDSGHLEMKPALYQVEKARGSITRRYLHLVGGKLT